MVLPLIVQITARIPNNQVQLYLQFAYPIDLSFIIAWDLSSIIIFGWDWSFIILLAEIDHLLY